MDRKLKPILFVFSVFLASCSTVKIADTALLKNSARQEVKDKHITAAEAISETVEAIKAAEKSNLSFYSPGHLLKAKMKLKKAKSLYQLRSSKRSREVSATSAIMAQKILVAAEKNKQLVFNTIPEIVKQKNIIEALDAKNYVPQAYHAGIRQLKVVIRLIENGQTHFLEAKTARVLETLNQIEADVIKITSLEATKEMIKKAYAIHAFRYAPMSYQAAKDEYYKAKSFIDKNAKNKNAVDEVVTSAYQAALKSFNFALESQKITSGNTKSVEAYILKVQGWLNQINEKAKVENLESYQLKEQIKLLLESLGDAEALSVDDEVDSLEVSEEVASVLPNQEIVKELEVTPKVLIKE